VHEYDEAATLAELLEVPRSALPYLASQSVYDLPFSVRASNRFLAARIQSLADLMRWTPAQLLRLPNMGRRTVREVLEVLARFLPGSMLGTSSVRPRPVPPDGVCLPLRHEWATFAGIDHCPGNIGTERLCLSHTTRSRLAELGVNRVNDMLDWPMDTNNASLGGDAVADLLDALPALAVEARCTVAERPTARAVAHILARRWADVPIDTLQLCAESKAALKDAGVLDLGHLLEALNPLAPALYLDLPTFHDVWQQLVGLSLKCGEPSTARQELVAASPQALSLSIVSERCAQLCTPRQWHVLRERYALRRPGRSEDLDGRTEGPRRGATLGALASELGMSREGVRQVERRAEQRVVKPGSPLHAVSRTLAALMREAGGVLSVADSAEALLDHLAPGPADPEGVCYLVYELCPGFARLERGAVYALPDAASSYADVIANAAELWARSSEHPSGEELVFQVVKKRRACGIKVDESYVRACIRADGRFLKARTKWTYPELAERVLRDAGEPLHFSVIAQRAEALSFKTYVSVGGVHNALVSDRDRFAFVGPGTFGLTEWGLDSVGKYPDLIAGLLQERGSTLTSGEILAGVTARRPIKQQSLWMFLEMHPRFYRSVEGEYGLRAWLPPRERQTLRTPSWQVEEASSYERVEKAAERGYDVEAIVAKDRT
jgi:hypothetical protein